jgi:hypothetical protein
VPDVATFPPVAMNRTALLSAQVLSLREHDVLMPWAIPSAGSGNDYSLGIGACGLVAVLRDTPKQILPAQRPDEG